MSESTPTWTRNGDTIHASPDCPSLLRAKRPVKWEYANGMSPTQVSAELIAAPWLRQCRRCFVEQVGE